MGGIICILLAALLAVSAAYVIMRIRLRRLTRQAEDFLTLGGQPLAFSVREDALAPVHNAIAELEKEWDVTVVTQNVDNLHERAGSTRVFHLHGQLTKVRPENCCNEMDGFDESTVFDIGYDVINLGDLAPNGAQLRPHIVWFGEPVPYINAAIDHVENADVLLIVGTSLQVYPAAGLYAYAKAGTPIYIIDPAEVLVKDGRLTHIKEVATSGMETFKNILKSK